MSDACRHDCPPLLRFPRRPHNRPGLSRIDYRIGAYADFRAALLRALDAEPLLADWTHRGADDPGIALLEGAAILGDILTMYQEVYANEAYLRTARWYDSVAALVRLTGYRLSPGLGGRGFFAFELRGTTTRHVPQGFPLSARLADQGTTTEFQTDEALTAHPHLSSFQLYRPRREKQRIGRGGNRLELEAVFTGSGEDERQLRDVTSLQTIGLQPGNRLLLLPAGEIITITAVNQVLDRIILEFSGTLTRDHGTTVEACRIGRSFRHFGHNAPALTSELRGSGDRQHLHQEETIFSRHTYTTHTRYCTLQANEIALDSSAADLATGTLLICQVCFLLTVSGVELSGEEHSFTIEEISTALHRIDTLRADALSWGNLTAAATVLTMDQNLSRDAVDADIRKCLFHEVLGPRMTLRAPSDWQDGPLDEHYLQYWGTYDQVQPLAGRRLLLHKSADETFRVTVTTTAAGLNEALAERDAIHPWLWPLFLAPPPPQLTLADFAEEQGRVTVFGNVVLASQGKSQREAILGNGDAREAFQSFKLPKAPLTHFLADEETPPEIPELQVFVNGRQWQRVPSFFGHGPGESIYIVRQDDNGDSWVQFGDGLTGRRLPSGVQNIVGRYRTGIAARGALKEGAGVQAGAPLQDLRAIHLPGLVSGGAEPEGRESAQQAAPGKVQGLGRLVSLGDYESELQALSGIRKAAARWTLEQNIPTMTVTVLPEASGAQDEEAWRELLTRAHRERGAQRFPLAVHIASRQYVYLYLQVAHDPSYRTELLTQTIGQVLGVSGAATPPDVQGLFSEKHRRFGQTEYATRIEGAVQNIAGVVWVQVHSLGFVTGAGNDPLTLQEPEELVNEREVLSNPARSEPPERVLLCLHARHCHVVLTAVDATEVPPHD